MEEIKSLQILQDWTQTSERKDMKLRSVLDIFMDFKHCNSNITIFSEQKTALKLVLWSVYDQEVNMSNFNCFWSSKRFNMAGALFIL